MDSLLQPLVRDRPDELARRAHCPHQAHACGDRGVGRFRRPKHPLCRLDGGIAKDIVRQLRRTQLHPVHDRIGVTPQADRIDKCQAAHAPRVRRRQLARDHAAERVPDDQRFFDLQSRQQLVVAEDQIPEAVEPIDVVVRLRRRPRMLGRINREAPRQIVEKRIPREPPRAVEKDQRRP